jgi:CheY-like chemotaxis protein
MTCTALSIFVRAFWAAGLYLGLMMERYDSGFRLVHHICKEEHLKDTPIVVLSAVVSAAGERFGQE